MVHSDLRLEKPDILCHFRKLYPPSDFLIKFGILKLLFV
jgi:hypothetical protein